MILKKVVRLLFRLLKRTVLFLLSAVTVYVLAALLLSWIKTHPKDTGCTPGYDVFITTNGVHLDIIVPVGYISPGFLKQLDLLPETRFVSFGWGDREFYIHTPEWPILPSPPLLRRFS